MAVVMKLRPLVLAIEGDDRVAEALRDGLQKCAIDTVFAKSGAAALRSLSAVAPDVVLIDTELDGESADALREKVQGRDDAADIIVVVARRSTPAFEALAPTFVLETDGLAQRALTPRNLGKRIASFLRARTVSVLDAALEAGPLRFDGHSARAYVHGGEIELTTMELRLLAIFSKRPGRVLTREQLVREVWGIRPRGDTRTIDTHVKRLRHKLGAAAPLLATVRGVGYRLETAMFDGAATATG